MPRHTLPTIPIPSFVSNIFAQFPLVTYEGQDYSTPAPKAPTLWLSAPSAFTSSSSSASRELEKDLLDPYSLQALTLARFLGVEHEIRWLESSAGAPGGQLPSLHLPSGDLLSRNEISSHLVKNSAGGVSATTAADAVHQAFTALIETSLLPAVLALIHLSTPTNKSSPRSPASPSSSQPYLSSLVTSFLAIGHRADRIAEIHKLRGGKGATHAILDLELVEREAIQALHALEVKIKDTANKGEWFNDSSSPSELDSWIYALVSIILAVPNATESGLKPELNRCPSLLKWVKSKRASS